MTFIPLHTPVGCFLYDRGEDALLPISDDEFNKLNCVVNYENQRDDIIRRYNNHGLCMKNPVEFIEHPASKNIGRLLESHVEQVLLQLTADECMDCWAFKDCVICVAQIVVCGHVSKAEKLKRCHIAMDDAASKLMDMAVLMHYGYDFEKNS